MQSQFSTSSVSNRNIQHAVTMEEARSAPKEEEWLLSRDGAFMMKEASGAQQDDKQLSSRTEEGCEARVEDKLFSAREDANTLRRLQEPGLHRTTRPDRLGAGGAREEARANTKAEMVDRAGENATDTAA